MGKQSIGAIRDALIQKESREVMRKILNAMKIEGISQQLVRTQWGYDDDDTFTARKKNPEKLKLRELIIAAHTAGIDSITINIK